MQTYFRDYFTDAIVRYFIGLLLVFVCIQWYIRKPKNIPPGPKGLPLLGSLLYFIRNPYRKLCNLQKEYGPICSVYIGNRLVIIMNDYETIHEALVQKADIFSGRPKEFINSFPVDDYPSIVTSDSNYWRDHRKFFMMLMRHYGVGQTTIEPRIMHEIQCFIAKLKSLEGKAKNIREILSISIANNIMIMTLGKRFEYGDNNFVKIKRTMDEVVGHSSAISPFMFYPWLKYIVFVRKYTKYDRLIQCISKLYDFINERIEEFKDQFIEGEKDNYIAAFLSQQAKKAKQSKPEVEYFTAEALSSNIRSLLMAGTETTTDTLLWAIIYMLHCPEIQCKIHKELDEVIGSDRTPSWTDHLLTPYTEATLCELQRMINHVPLSLPHRNTQECTIRGYTIPKDTCIILNLGNVLADPKHWGDPEKFRPERFLNDKGEIEKPPYFIPFSLGKRECLGKSFAKMEVYLYFTSMMQAFEFQPDSGPLPPLEGYFDVTHRPKEFKVRVIPRNLKTAIH